MRRAVHMTRALWIAMGIAVGLLAKPAPVRADSATLSVEELIRGMNTLKDNWMSQKSWMLHYTHSRKPGVQQTRLPLFPDADVINARKGPWLFVHDKQELLTEDAQHATGQMYERWASWNGKISLERQSDIVQILPEPSARPYQMLYYTSLLYLDLLSDMRIRSDDLKRLFGGEVPSNGFWEALPRSVVEHQSEFKVRPQLEEVDGAACHVLEWPDKDVLWIDTEHAFLCRHRVYYQSPGSPLFEMSNQDIHERAQGIWLPSKSTAMRYNFDQAPPEYRGKPEVLISNVLLEARFNDLPDSYFEVPIPEQGTVNDHLRGVMYMKHPEGADPWATAIETARTRAAPTRQRNWVEITLLIGIAAGVVLLVYQMWRMNRRTRAARPDGPWPTPDPASAP
jgi:hypothetical protein